jgi:lysine 6-dehydrogenase
MKILVLGSGRMGLGAAYDLAHATDVEAVTVADVDIERARAFASTLKSAKLTPAQVDVSDRQQAIELMRGHDAVISCVGYVHNVQLSRAAVEARVNFCDLGGNNRVVAEELALDGEARAASINIIPDCGLAPGMVSILVAHGAARFEQLDEIHIRVGGLPQNPQPPLDYQIVFAVEGLINEYVERARVIRRGEIIEVDSLTEVETLRFPAPYERMEAFQTSGGTSTLPETFSGSVRELDYKTIRYPGHCERFRLLLDLGLAGSEPVDVDGTTVRPRRVLGAMLQRHLPADGPDVVLVRVEFRGLLKTQEQELVQQLIEVGQISEDEAKAGMFRNVIKKATDAQHTTKGKRTTLCYDIIDSFDAQTGLSAMMRTTAFPASIIAQMMARGETSGKGAIPQERCIPPDAFVAALAARNINIHESINEVSTDE